jgi:ABC-type glycerol-3-phosphate transport system substrate-binding protein
MPKTYDEFFAAADKIKKAGLIAVAHGGQNWQDFTTFESVVLGVGGAKFYDEALVKLDAKALASPTMTKSLETFRKIKGYTDPAAPGRDWNLATAMVMQGKAGFQFMGDWAKGEFIAAGKAPGILMADEKLARRYMDLGALFVAVGVDSMILSRQTSALAAKFKEGLAEMAASKGAY